MSKFVRASKFRHVFGKGAKPEEQYLDLKVSRNAWDSNLVKANPFFVAVCWEAAGGGAFAVLDIKAVGKQPAPALFSGHKQVVLDIDFNPFNDYIIASCSEDCRVNVYQIPETLSSQSAPATTLNGHQRRVGEVKWHPTAENLLASSSGDLAIKLWDVTQGKEMSQILGCTDQIQSFSFNGIGNLVVATAKDKKTRVFDVRTGKETASGNGHAGVKPQRTVWLGDGDKFATTGFSKQSDRQLWIWSTTDMSNPLSQTDLDTSSGTLAPFYDEDTCMLYLSGKGDGNIRYFEIVDEKPYSFLLSEYGSKESCRGMAFLPKRACDVSNVEVARAFKAMPNCIEPITFSVPRKSDLFQADIFPDTKAAEASETIASFYGGSNKPLARVSMENGFTAGAKKQVDFKAPEPPGQKHQKDLENPTNEKEYKEAWLKLKEDNKILQDKLANRDVAIRGLELKLKEAGLS